MTLLYAELYVPGNEQESYLTDQQAAVKCW